MKVTIKAMRVNRGLTQREAAERMGIDPATIYNWETGRTLPSRRMMAKICEAYQCGIDDIFLPYEFTQSST